jgi:hypothetical protein
VCKSHSGDLVMAVPRASWGLPPLQPRAFSQCTSYSAQNSIIGLISVSMLPGCHTKYRTLHTKLREVYASTDNKAVEVSRPKSSPGHVLTATARLDF